MFRTKKQQAQRSSESTLVPSFASLQLKKFELEFAVDPLFKKASADFDEGGAKGLLLNHLAIDAQGRIVFDSSDDAGDATAEGDAARRRSGAADQEEEDDKEDVKEATPIPVESADECETEIDIAALGSKFFPDLDRLEEQDICPSLKNFDLGDPSGSLDIPFLKAPEDWRQDKNEAKDEAKDADNRSGIVLDDDNAAGFDDDDGMLGGFDLPVDTGFGEGGEVWAKDAALEPQMRVHNVDRDEAGGEDEGADVGSFDPESGQYTVSLKHQGERDHHEDILSYFDNALKKNWAGPEHWRIRRIKDSSIAKTPGPTKRKEKEPFEIDFTAPLDAALAEAIYTPASSNSVISLPKAQWKSKTRNLLPDDKHFNSRQLLRLFLKPKARIGSRRPGFGRSKAEPSVPDQAPDEAYWASQKPEQGAADDEGREGDYDANFFADDPLAFPAGLPDDDDDFADAREEFAPNFDEVDPAAAPLDADGVVSSQVEGGYGSQLVTQSRRLRPEYVQYARVAKKVDVRRLKEEMWRGIGLWDPTKPQEPNVSPTLLHFVQTKANPSSAAITSPLSRASFAHETSPS